MKRRNLQVFDTATSELHQQLVPPECEPEVELEEWAADAEAEAVPVLALELASLAAVVGEVVVVRAAVGHWLAACH